MTDKPTGPGRRRLRFDGTVIVVGAACTVGGLLLNLETLFIIGSYGILLGSSTTVVSAGLSWFTGSGVRGEYPSDSGVRERAMSLITGRALENKTDREQDTGWLIGRLENVLVLTLVYLGAYTALSIIFAAKSFVRREDIASGDTAYYLAGTLINFTYSILLGLGAVWFLDYL